MGSNWLRRKPAHGDRLEVADNLVFRKSTSIPLPYSRATRTFTPPSPSNRANAITTGGRRQCPRHNQRGTQEAHHGVRTVGGRIQFPRQGLANPPWFGTFRPYDNEGSLCQAGLGLCSTDGSSQALDEGSSLDLTQQGVFLTFEHQPASWHYLLGTKTDNRSFTSGRNPPRRRCPKPRLPVPPSAHTPGQFQFPKSPTWPDRKGDRSPPCGSNRGFAWRR